MPGIFNDEQRRNGVFSRGPFRVGSKWLLDASKMLESVGHFLALFFFPATILIPTQHRVLHINRP